MNLFIHESVNEDGYQLAKEISNLHHKDAIVEFLNHKGLVLEEDDDNNLFIANAADQSKSNLFRFYRLQEYRI